MISMNTDPNTQPQEKPTLGQLWQDVKKHHKLYYKVLGITFIVSAIITLSIPNYYKCTVMLAPELSGGNKSTSGLASLASSFGVNLGSANSGMDAILPTFYPDLMNSVTFRASLFPIKIHREDEMETMSYYDYLKDGQKAPWWSQATKAVFSLFTATPEVADDKLNTFKLTKEQSAVVETIGKKVVCDVDKKTMVITIDVTDQDPLICATMADSVRVRLQDFITDYRTSKARVDLDYTRKLYAEAKAKYDQARSKYATYADANQRVFLERVRSEQSELQTELQLAQTAYTQVASRLQLAEAKVQEETPSFTTLQSATVPVKKTGPKRAQSVLIFLFLAFIGTSVWILYKENQLKPLLGLG
jgi:capsular polysaccharide biosynthesis protein